MQAMAPSARPCLAIAALLGLLALHCHAGPACYPGEFTSDVMVTFRQPATFFTGPGRFFFDNSNNRSVISMTGLTIVNVSPNGTGVQDTVYTNVNSGFFTLNSESYTYFKAAGQPGSCEKKPNGPWENVCIPVIGGHDGYAGITGDELDVIVYKPPTKPPMLEQVVLSKQTHAPISLLLQEDDGISLGFSNVNFLNTVGTVDPSAFKLPAECGSGSATPAKDLPVHAALRRLQKAMA